MIMKKADGEFYFKFFKLSRFSNATIFEPKLFDIFFTVFKLGTVGTVAVRSAQVGQIVFTVGRAPQRLSDGCRRLGTYLDILKRLLVVQNDVGGVGRC
jgi:hypothetical protein